MDFKNLSDHIPVRPFAPHALTEFAPVEHSSLHLLDPVNHFPRAKWELFFQSLEEIRADATGQTEEIDKCRPRAGIACQFEELGNLVFIQSRDDRSNPETHFNTRIGKLFHGFEPRFREWRKRFEGAIEVVIEERNGEKERELSFL